MSSRKYLVRIGCILFLVSTVQAAALARVRRTTPAPATEHAATERAAPFTEDERSMLIRVIQEEHGHLDMLLRMLHASDGRRGVATTSPTGTSPGTPSAGVAVEPPPPEDAPKASRSVRAAAASPGTVTGKVSVQGASAEDVVIYVDGPRERSARRNVLEIKQVNKQFVPRLAVAVRGATVKFPNMDSVFHNVFSLSPGNTFDLGSKRAGDAPGQVSLESPGVVQIFCNMHSQMAATVFVVPNSTFTRAGGDGQFRLTNVQAGRRKIVAWAPGSDPVVREVEVPSSGEVSVNFAFNARGALAHTNKFGQPYGSYQE